MNSKKIRRVLATAAVTILTGAVASPVMTVSAEQLLGETSFDYKMLPWEPCEASPARQYFVVEDGAVTVMSANGADGERWDLQFKHRNLNFRAGHKYQVSFKAKAKRDGMQLCSQISNISCNQEYFVLYGDKMQMGASMGGDQWAEASQLTTEYQEFSGTFIPTRDIEAADWTFHYANGKTFGGNAVDGDELWFDDMSIDEVTYQVNNVLYGDVDLNGTIDLSDLIRLSKYLLNDMTFSEKALEAADCDGDGLVSITDLSYLRQYITKDPITLGPKK